jgi:hypothetical protein
MKYIFPQNYDFSSKIFGIIDYSTLILNVIWAIFIFYLGKLIFYSITFRIYFFTILYLPILIFSIIGFNHENILYVVYYIYKYNKSKNVFLYK